MQSSQQSPQQSIAFPTSYQKECMMLSAQALDKGDEETALHYWRLAKYQKPSVTI
jgi:hypothetical protein